MKILRISILTIFAAALCACEIPFALDNVSESVLYVQYLPLSGEEATGIRVSYADPAFGKDSGKRYCVSADEVSLSVNGTSLPVPSRTVEHDGNQTTLFPGVRFAPGDRVRLEVSGRGVKNIWGETTVPARPEIESVSLEKVTRDSSDATKVMLKLKNAVADGEYYGLKTAVRSTTVTLITPKMPDLPPFPMPSAGFPGLPVKTDTTVTTFYTTAGQLATTADIYNLDLDGFASIGYKNGFIGGGLLSGEPMMLLTSRQFDGGLYSFYVNSFDSFNWSDIDFSFDDSGTPDDWTEDPGGEPPAEEPEDPEDDTVRTVIYYKQEVRLEVYRLSEELYNYCKAQYLGTFNILSNFGVTPPNFTYTNVHDGIGIVGALSETSTDWQTLSEFEMSAQDIMEILFPKTPGGH